MNLIRNGPHSRIGFSTMRSLKAWPPSWAARMGKLISNNRGMPVVSDRIAMRTSHPPDGARAPNRVALAWTA